jgi:hypothetical protein
LWRWQDEVKSEIEKEPNSTKTPEWIGHGAGTDPVEAIAAKLGLPEVI